MGEDTGEDMAEATVDMEDLGVDDRVVALVEGLEEDRVGVGNDRELLDVAW